MASCARVQTQYHQPKAVRDFALPAEFHKQSIADWVRPETLLGRRHDHLHDLALKQADTVSELYKTAMKPPAATLERPKFDSSLASASLDSSKIGHSLAAPDFVPCQTLVNHFPKGPPNFDFGSNVGGSLKSEAPTQAAVETTSTFDWATIILGLLMCAAGTCGVFYGIETGQWWAVGGSATAALGGAALVVRGFQTRIEN